MFIWAKGVGIASLVLRAVFNVAAQLVEFRLVLPPHQIHEIYCKLNNITSTSSHDVELQFAPG